MINTKKIRNQSIKINKSINQ